MLVLALFACASSAAAQAKAPALVIIDGQEPVSYLLGYKDLPPFLECEAACSFYGEAPARYTLSVRGEGYVQSSRTFEVSGPSRVLVEPRSEGQRTLGLVLGVVGAGLLLGGSVMLLNTDSRGDSKAGQLLIGTLAFATGAILTPIGFVKYGHTSPSIQVEPL
jgi:hypothetical protein